MEDSKKALDLIAKALLSEYSRLYYVDVDTNAYQMYTSKEDMYGLVLEPAGADFFLKVEGDVENLVYKDDKELVCETMRKDRLLENIKKGTMTDMTYRLVIRRKPVYHSLRIFYSSHEGKEYLVVGVLNIDESYRNKLANEEMEKKLHSANRMARLDELTGVRNKNAYQEFVNSIDSNIKMGASDYKVCVVVCDMNDLKVLNDTRGHSFGDEAIQRSCRMICNAFNHSPVFRVGGDEFVAILLDRDYEEREQLIEKLKKESIANSHDRTGPVVACGAAVYKAESDTSFSEVFERADMQMYENKQQLKSVRLNEECRKLLEKEEVIPDECKRRFDKLFGALYTVSNGGYVFLNDMNYNYSRWSLPFVDDFGMPSEYMYRAGDIWKEHIHPEDIPLFDEVINEVFTKGSLTRNIMLRALDRNGDYVTCYQRAFILTDERGEPRYFGGVVLTIR